MALACGLLDLSLSYVHTERVCVCQSPGILGSVREPLFSQTRGQLTPKREVQPESASVSLNKSFLFLPRAADSLHATCFWIELLCDCSAVSVFVVFVLESGSLGWLLLIFLLFDIFI